MPEPTQKDLGEAEAFFFDIDVTCGDHDYGCVHELARLAAFRAAAREEVYLERSKTVAEIIKAERERIVGRIRHLVANATQEATGRLGHQYWAVDRNALLAQLDEIEKEGTPCQ